MKRRHNNRFVPIFGLILFLAYFLTPSMPSAISAQASTQDIELLNIYGGGFSRFSISGDFGYVVEGLTISRFDLSNLANPIRIGRTGSMGDYVSSISAYGDFVFITGNFGFRLIDFSNPSLPSIVWSNYDFGWYASLYINSHYMYIVENSELVILDISNPASPFEVSHLTLGPNVHAFEVEVQGRYAYIASWEGLFVVDIYDLSTPEIVVNIIGVFAGITVSGDRAYLLPAHSQGRTVVYDIQNPLQPVEMSRLWNFEGMSQLEIVGDYGYAISNNPAGLCSFDLVNEEIINCYPEYPVGSRLLFSDNKLFITSGDLSIHSPTLSGGLNLIGIIAGFSIYGDLMAQGDIVYTYQSKGTGWGLASVDLSDPVNPFALDFLPVDYPLEFSLHNQVAAIVETEQLTLIDISNPDKLSYITSISLQGTNAQHLAASAGMVFVSSSFGLEIFDISDPADPRPLQGFPTPGSLFSGDVAIQGDQAFWVSESTIYILDISDPASPQVVGSWLGENWAADLAVSDSVLCASINTGVTCLDIHDPTSPTTISTIPFSSQDIEIIDNRLYVAAQYFGIYIYDISDPAIPIEIAHNEENYWVGNLTPVPGLILASGAGGSLIIFSNPLDDPVPVFDVTIILAEPSDVRHEPAHDAAYFTDLFEQLVDYYNEVSMGRVHLRLKAILDNDSNWYGLDQTYQYFVGKEDDFFVEAIFSALGIDYEPANNEFFLIVHSGAGKKVRNDNHMQSQMFPYGALLAETEHIGAYAHEVGHLLGHYLYHSPTPDLYLMGNVNKWDLMASGAWNGGFLNIEGTHPPHMGSYTKEFLGWLRYQRYDLGEAGAWWIDALAEHSYNDPIIQYVMETRSDNTPDKYYFVETRNPQDECHRWDASAPQTGLVLYWVDTKGLPKHGSYEENISQNIDIATVLNSPGFLRTSEYFDPVYLTTFRVTQEDQAACHYSAKLEISPAAPPQENLAGIILLPDGQVALDIAPIYQTAIPVLNPVEGPDLDLHVYTTDGRHIGVNYVTGVYENQVDGALTSGDRFNSNEWILLPEGIDYHYVVRSLSTAQFLQDYPEALAYTSGVDSYQIYGLGGNPSSGYFTNDPQKVSIASGLEYEHTLVVSQLSETLEVGAAAPAVLSYDLTVSLQAPSRLACGNDIPIKLTYGNSGGSLSEPATLRISIPEGMELLENSPFIYVEDNMFRLDVPALEPGSTHIIEYVLRPSACMTGEVNLWSDFYVNEPTMQDLVLENNFASVSTMINVEIYLPAIFTEIKNPG